MEVREVETVIMTHPRITRAVVIFDDALRALVAYLTGDFETAAVLATIRQRLPDYMVPAAVMPMDHMPLTANGKLDRASLPPPVSTGTRALAGSFANAARVAKRIRDTFQVDFSVRMIFDAPTVAELAVRVSQLLATTATI